MVSGRCVPEEVSSVRDTGDQVSLRRRPEQSPGREGSGVRRAARRTNTDSPLVQFPPRRERITRQTFNNAP